MRYLPLMRRPTHGTGGGAPGQLHHSPRTRLHLIRFYGVLAPKARLLKRVFELDLEHCPNCGGELKIIAAILEPPVIEKTLTHLGLQARAPPRAPARGKTDSSASSAVFGVPRAKKKGRLKTLPSLSGSRSSAPGWVRCNPNVRSTTLRYPHPLVLHPVPLTLRLRGRGG